MDHVMIVDQHVRYALVLQAALGTMLAASLGFFPGGNALMWTAALVGGAWLLFVELVHRLRHRSLGSRLAIADRWSRYLLIALLLALAGGILGGDWPIPTWLQWKLACFAGVVACGAGIRLKLIGWFECWNALRADPESSALNTELMDHYWAATRVLLLLWLFIVATVALSLMKPAL